MTKVFFSDGYNAFGVSKEVEFESYDHARMEAFGFILRNVESEGRPATIKSDRKYQDNEQGKICEIERISAYYGEYERYFVVITHTLFE